MQELEVGFLVGCITPWKNERTNEKKKKKLLLLPTIDN